VHRDARLTTFPDETGLRTPENMAATTILYAPTVKDTEYGIGDLQSASADERQKPLKQLWLRDKETSVYYAERLATSHGRNITDGSLRPQAKNDLLPSNSAPFHIRNSAKPLKSGKIADDTEITKTRQLFLSWQLSVLRILFTLGENRFCWFCNLLKSLDLCSSPKSDSD
jgi:hypothetical protein